MRRCYLCVKHYFLLTKVQKLWKSLNNFQSYDHKCTATFLSFTVYNLTEQWQWLYWKQRKIKISDTSIGRVSNKSGSQIITLFSTAWQDNELRYCCCYHDAQFHRWTVRSAPPEHIALFVSTSMHVTAAVINNSKQVTVWHFTCTAWNNYVQKN